MKLCEETTYRNHPFSGPAMSACRSCHAGAVHCIERVVLSLGPLVMCLLVLGCNRSTVEAPLPAPGVTLSVLVVDDPELADAIARRRGEWNAVSGGELQITQATSDDLTLSLGPDGSEIDADAIVFPSLWLGPLAESERIIPLRESILSGDDYRLDDLLPRIADVETVWGGRAMAAPLGSPVLVLAYRADLFRGLGLAPPRTWEEYDALAARLADRNGLGAWAPPEDAPWRATAQPFAPGWAVVTFLARAAAYAASPHRYSTLFDAETMSPQIAGPPFVRALEELVETQRGAIGDASDAPALDPAGAWNALLKGEAAMAITWPAAAPATAPATALGSLSAEIPSPEVEIAFAELPGASEVYRAELDAWEPRPDDRQRVTLLGLSGRMAAATRTSKNATSALRLVAWLSGGGGDVDRPVSAASRGATLYRRSHSKNPDVWLGGAIARTAASQYFDVVSDTLSRRDQVALPRVSGGSAYLTSLDGAVRSALDQQLAPADALKQAADDWRTITARQESEDAQRAYLHSLNLRTADRSGRPL
jgi:ABC-type glycerol-3-phosphate transport system substrate-binding protein